jgi:hypothetical protein
MKSARRADDQGMTRLVHQCGAAFQFAAWLAIWVILAAVVV